jgi:hypothetical protein
MYEAIVMKKLGRRRLEDKKKRKKIVVLLKINRESFDWGSIIISCKLEKNQMKRFILSRVSVSRSIKGEA